MTTTNRYYSSATPTQTGPGTQAAFTNLSRVVGPPDGSAATSSSFALNHYTKQVNFAPSADATWPVDGSRTIVAVRIGAQASSSEGSNSGLLQGFCSGVAGDQLGNVQDATLQPVMDTFLLGVVPTITDAQINGGTIPGCGAQFLNYGDLNTVIGIDTLWIEIDWIPTPAPSTVNARRQHHRRLLPLE